MDLSFTKSQELLQKAARQFAENELEPRAAAIDDAHTFPMDTFRLMARYGYTGIGVPVEYGGVGGGSVEEVIAVTEFAKKCMASAATLSIHLITPHILTQFGTEEQKKAYLPRLTKGGEVAAFALTEPNAGSDAASASTTAIYDPDTDEYVLNGTKCFITGGSRASVLIIFALTEPQKGLKGMSAIIVEAGTPGFTVGKVENKMGLRGSETAELIFEDCRVPAANLVGRPGQGFKMAMMALDSARIGTGAQAVGIAEGAIDLSVKYMHERVQFGKPIAALQGLPNGWSTGQHTCTTQGSLTARSRPCASSMPRKMPALSPIWPCRSMAATDTCTTIPLSACTVTPSLRRSTRVRPRSTRWSFPVQFWANKTGFFSIFTIGSAQLPLLKTRKAAIAAFRVSLSKNPSFQKTKAGVFCNLDGNKQISVRKWSSSNSIVPAFSDSWQHI